MIGGGPNSYELFTLGPQRVWHRIRADILTIASRQLRVTVSCGVANFKEDGHSRDSFWCTCEKVG